MLKRILAVVMTMTICVNLGITALATSETVESEENIKVVNYSETISEQEIQEIVDDVKASLVYEDGTIVPIETTITIKDVETITSTLRSSDSSNTYAVTANSKVESDADSKNNEGVSASIYLGLVWQDVLGPNNILESVSGYVNVTKGTIESSTVKYGAAGEAGSWTTLELGKQTSFAKSVNMEAYIPHATYTVYFEGATFYLNVSVTPTIFD